MTERPTSRLSRVATAISTAAMASLLYLLLFARSTTSPMVWAAAVFFWLAPVGVIAVVERK